MKKEEKEQHINDARKALRAALRHLDNRRITQARGRAYEAYVECQIAAEGCSCIGLEHRFECRRNPFNKKSRKNETRTKTGAI